MVIINSARMWDPEDTLITYSARLRDLLDRHKKVYKDEIIRDTEGRFRSWHYEVGGPAAA